MTTKKSQARPATLVAATPRTARMDTGEPYEENELVLHFIAGSGGEYAVILGNTRGATTEATVDRWYSAKTPSGLGDPPRPGRCMIFPPTLPGLRVLGLRAE